MLMLTRPKCNADVLAQRFKSIHALAIPGTMSPALIVPKGLPPNPTLESRILGPHNLRT